MPIELIFEPQNLEDTENLYEVNLNGTFVQMRKNAANGSATMCRLISTDPQKYLNNAYQPGKIVKKKFW